MFGEGWLTVAITVSRRRVKVNIGTQLRRTQDCTLITAIVRCDVEIPVANAWIDMRNSSTFYFILGEVYGTLTFVFSNAIDYNSL